MVEQIISDFRVKVLHSNPKEYGSKLITTILPQQAQAATIASKGAGGLSSTLNNVQQVLKVVQSTAPLVQEYGPMVKNLPAMYRMMKAFKNFNLTEDDTKVETKENVEEQAVPSNNTHKIRELKITN
ncbi:hypothetical protein CV093_10950 [Oceanobacillus sp. 143]|nr:hypothetical protein CV093_10950 [Oceanobacillus sp. 143]